MAVTTAAGCSGAHGLESEFVGGFLLGQQHCSGLQRCSTVEGILVISTYFCVHLLITIFLAVIYNYLGSLNGT